MSHVLEFAKQIAYSSEETLMLTHKMARKFRGGEGCYIECGVAAGAQIIAMIHGAPDKKIYACDSFEGLPLPSNRDDQMPGLVMLSETEQKALPNPGEQELVTTGVVSVSVDEFLMNLRKSGLKHADVETVVGWFENTIPELAKTIEPISILRLDGDLYNSTWVCLVCLFPKVLPGAVVIIDDYALKGCRDACDEYFAFVGYEPEYNFIEGDGYRVAWFYK